MAVVFVEHSRTAIFSKYLINNAYAFTQIRQARAGGRNDSYSGGPGRQPCSRSDLVQHRISR